MVKDKKNIESIALFRALQLGDLLCSTPAIRSIRSAYPNAEITLIGLPWAESFVQRYSKYLDAFISFPGYPGLPEQTPKTTEVIDFLTKVQKKKFDLAIQIHGSGVVTNPLIQRFEAKYSAGFYQEGGTRPSQFFYPYPEGQSERDIWLTLCANLGITSTDKRLELPIFPTERQRAKELMSLLALRPFTYVCLHPGARDKERRLLPQTFAALGDYVAEQGYTIVLTGSADEKAITSEVSAAMKHKPIDLSGKTTIGELAEILKKAAFLIANDTGVSHIADAVDAPSIIAYKTSDPQRWAPLNRDLHKVINAKDVTPDVVVHRIQEAISNRFKMHSY